MKSEFDIHQYYNEHFESMIAIATVICGNRDKAEDVVQDVYVELIEKGVAVATRPYLLSMVSCRAKNKSRNTYRKDDHLSRIATESNSVLASSDSYEQEEVYLAVDVLHDITES